MTRVQAINAVRANLESQTSEPVDQIGYNAIIDHAHQLYAVRDQISPDLQEAVLVLIPHQIPVYQAQVQETRDALSAAIEGVDLLDDFDAAARAALIRTLEDLRNNLPDTFPG